MAILNYSTKIKIEKTAGEIQEKLARAKAQAVLCEYDSDGTMSAMSFRLATPHGIISFRLPINIDGVLKSIMKNKKIPRNLKTRQQAARVALRIIKDWIEAQLAIVEADMAKVEEVFLPYVQNPNTGKTLFETIEGNGFKQLTDNQKSFSKEE